MTTTLSLVWDVGGGGGGDVDGGRGPLRLWLGAHQLHIYSR